MPPSKFLPEPEIWEDFFGPDQPEPYPQRRVGQAVPALFKTAQEGTPAEGFDSGGTTAILSGWPSLSVALGQSK